MVSSLRATSGAVLVALVVLLSATANATHVCEKALVVSVADVAYVADDCTFNSADCFMFSVWVYVESNGEGGLQRGGANLFGEADVCQTSSNPDTAVL